MTTAAPPRIPHAAASREALRILFLAARPAVIGPLRESLRHDPGLQLQLAVEPDDVVAMLRHTRFDLVLLDLPWTGRAGQRLVGQLRAQNAATRIVVLGDLSGNRAREAARRIGANGFTPAPGSAQLPRVLRALARPSQRRAAPAPQRPRALEAA